MNALYSSGCQHNPFGCGCVKAYRRLYNEVKKLRLKVKQK